MPTGLHRVHAGEAPGPLGAYPHAVVARGLVHLSGQGSRDPRGGHVVGVERDAAGAIVARDVDAATEACLGNVRRVLLAAGSDLDRLVELQVFLVDMADFATMNAVYARWFPEGGPARTTVGVAALPAGNIIEMRGVALAPGVEEEGAP